MMDLYRLVREFIDDSPVFRIDGSSVLISKNAQHCSGVVVIPVLTEARIRISLRYCNRIPNIESLKDELELLIGTGDDTVKVLGQNNPVNKVRVFLEYLEQSLLDGHPSAHEDVDSEEASISEEEPLCKNCNRPLEFVPLRPHWKSYYKCPDFHSIDNPFCDNYLRF